MLQYKRYIIKSLVYIAKCMLSINESEGSQKTQSESEMARGSRLNQKEPEDPVRIRDGQRFSPESEGSQKVHRDPRWPEDLV